MLTTMAKFTVQGTVAMLRKNYTYNKSPFTWVLINCGESSVGVTIFQSYDKDNTRETLCEGDVIRAEGVINSYKPKGGGKSYTIALNVTSFGILEKAMEPDFFSDEDPPEDDGAPDITDDDLEQMIPPDAAMLPNVGYE